MKKLIFFVLLAAGIYQVSAQTLPCPTNQSCSTALSLCNDTIQDLCDNKIMYWYSFESTIQGQQVEVAMQSNTGFNYWIYGPASLSQPCSNLSSQLVSSGGAVLVQETLNATGLYYMAVMPSTPYDRVSIDFTPDNPCTAITINCPNVSGDFVLCDGALELCGDTTQILCLSGWYNTSNQHFSYWYTFEANDPGQILDVSMTSGDDFVYGLLGPIPSYPIPNALCTESDISSWLIDNDTTNGLSYTIGNTGIYLLGIVPFNDNEEVNIDFTPDDLCDSLSIDTVDCPTNMSCKLEYDCALDFCDSALTICYDTIHQLCDSSSGYWYSFEAQSGQEVELSMVSGSGFGYLFAGGVYTGQPCGSMIFSLSALNDPNYFQYGQNVTSWQHTITTSGKYYIAVGPTILNDKVIINFTPDNLCDSLPIDTCPSNTICDSIQYLCNDTTFVLCDKGETWYSFDVDDPNQSINVTPSSGGIFGTRLYGPVTGSIPCDQNYLNSVQVGSANASSFQHAFNSTGLYYMLIKNGDVPNSLLIDFAPDLDCDKSTTPCPTNKICEDALSLCRDTIHDLCDRSVPLWYTFEVNTLGQEVAGSMLSGNPFTYFLYGPVNTSIPCTQYNWSTLQIAGSQTVTFQETINTIGTYYLVIIPIAPNEKIHINFSPDELCDLCPSNSDCNNPMVVCEDTKHTINCNCYEVGPKGEIYYPPLYYLFDVANPNQSVSMSTMVPSNNCKESSNGFDRIEFYGPLPSNLDLCRDLQNYLLQSYFGVPSASIMFANPGTYVAVVQPSGCDPKCPTGPDSIDVIIDFRPDDPCDRKVEIDTCETCIGSFAPIPGEKYMISAWASEIAASFNISTFTNPYIEISFPGLGVVGTFGPAGQIIDGWQRIEGSFEVPAGATSMDIELNSTSGKVLFDDIRVFPFNASMKSYVYDPINMRLVAELDERNYATFYEYDDEGKLSRIKKETEKGVMTIQETKQNTTKTP